MSNIKRMVALSDWISYELVPTPILNPSVIRVRVKATDLLSAQDVPDQDRKLSAVMKEVLIDSIKDWDLADDGKPIPCNEETKLALRPTLEALLGTEVSGTRVLLGLELLAYAANKENFLGNSRGSSDGGSTGTTPTV